MADEEDRYGWREGAKDIASFFGVVGLLVGIPVGTAFLYWANQKNLFIKNHKRFLEPLPIRRVYSERVNSDEFADVIVEYKNGEKTIFYGTGTGYVTSSQIEKLMKGERDK